MPSDPFEDLEADGILGLGMIRLSILPSFNLLSETKRQKDMNSFTIKYMKTISFQKSEMQNSSESKYYELAVKEVTVNGISSSEKLTFVVDSGTTFVSLPTKTY